MPAHRAILSLRLGRKLRVVHVEIGPRSIVLLWQKELSEYEPEHLADRERSETEKLRALIADWTRASGIAAEFDCFDGDEWRVTRHDRGKASMVVLAARHTQPVGHCETLRAVLLRTGHPVVMVQPECEGRLGRRLMVGSEDAPPLRRALALFLCTDVDGIAVVFAAGKRTLPLPEVKPSIRRFPHRPRAGRAVTRRKALAAGGPIPRCSGAARIALLRSRSPAWSPGCPPPRARRFRPARRCRPPP